MTVCYINRIFDAKRDKINVSDLCRTVGITRAYWYKVIASRSEPTVSVAIAITDYLNAQMESQGYEPNMYSVRDLWQTMP